MLRFCAFFAASWVRVACVLCVMAGVLMGVGVTSGCSEAAGVSASDYEHVYVVRGRVTQLPDGSPGGSFRARHEAIPEYVSANGSIGMDSMDMSFAIVDDAVLEGIALGDIVEITYGESSEPEVKQGVIAIKELPADTVLVFGEVEVRGDGD